MLEVLACAGSAEAVIAAVQSGADAIYIRFGGRGAHGFTESALAKSVRYCRVRACRVYAELDTLVADSEVAAAADLAKRACRGPGPAPAWRETHLPAARAFPGRNKGVGLALGSRARRSRPRRPLPGQGGAVLALGPDRRQQCQPR